MKSFVSVAMLSALFILTSCAHHHGVSKSCESQCDMHKDGKKEQCPIKSEHADSKAVEEAPAKK
ncbi:MAG: hypothetical protein H7281_04170 [Bacteriovorax sp.]|nr:hypothetical protein [Bacteriovorax sp.]